MKKILILMLTLVSLTMAQQVQNVEFTTLEGKKTSLYEILESGKHIFVHFSFNA